MGCDRISNVKPFIIELWELMMPRKKKKLPKLTRSDLRNEVVSMTGLTAVECQSMVNRVLDLMGEALEKEGEMKVSRFGKFGVRKKASRMGRNPKTKVEAVIKARNAVSFYPSRELRQAIKNSTE